MPTAAEIAAAIGATVEGDGACPIAGIAPIDAAGPTDLAFIVAASLAPRAQKSRARVVIAPPGADLPGKTVLRHRAPKVAFARAATRLVPVRRPPPGIHPSAVVAGDARLGCDVTIGPHAVVGARAAVGDRTILHAGAVVGDGARVGPDGVLHPHVVCYPGVTLGARVIVHAGTVIGSDGFGYAQEDAEAADAPDYRRYLQSDGPLEKVPQLGTVMIGDDVEIGANSAIARGTIGATTIGSGTKLDNHVHVAHNCVIGRWCLITAGVGFAGGVTLGDHVTVGGQAGFGEGSAMGDRSLLAPYAGLAPGKKVPAGEGWIGQPARRGDKGVKIMVSQAFLPGALETLRELRIRVKALEARRGKAAPGADA